MLEPLLSKFTSDDLPKNCLAAFAYENFEIASGLLQIGIVVASASIITGVAILSYAAGGLGLLSLVFMGLALLAPRLLF